MSINRIREEAARIVERWAAESRSVAELRVLALLAVHPAGLSIAVLAAQLGITRQAVQMSCARLHAAGRITRRAAVRRLRGTSNKRPFLYQLANQEPS
ncbi:MAG: MarR family transcriptional regulator [Verrucomicrobiaceae bacterium]|nr:MarR family transcriptional regulator [Verrucomicrobiaceae bacterium]